MKTNPLSLMEYLHCFYIELHSTQSKIPVYASSLLDQATEMLSKAWATEKFPIPKEMEAPFMRLVRMPDLKKYPIEDHTVS